MEYTCCRTGDSLWTTYFPHLPLRVPVRMFRGAALDPPRLENSAERKGGLVFTPTPDFAFPRGSPLNSSGLYLVDDRRGRVVRNLCLLLQGHQCDESLSSSDRREEEGILQEEDIVLMRTENLEC